MKKKKFKKIRKQVAKLYTSSGCGCCRNDEEWDKAADKLGKLLNIPRYSDDSGVNFYIVGTKEDEI